MKSLIPVTTLALIAIGCGSGLDRPGGGVIGTGAISLDEVQAAVFTPSCAISGCHIGLGAPFGLDLSEGHSFDSTIGIPSAEIPAFARVDPFDAENSYLFMKISGDPRIQGDPMPAFQPPLTAGDQQLVAEWIEQGARP